MIRRDLFKAIGGLFGLAVVGVPDSQADVIRKQRAARDAGGMYAWAGDIVCCENKHPVAQFTRDVKFGEMFDSRALTFPFLERRPEIGAMTQPCRCGKDWFRGTNFHFADGWR